MTPSSQSNGQGSRVTHWYEWITEAAWFKRLDDPKTKIGHWITTLVALAFGVLAFMQNPNQTRDCQSNPLRDVYNPQRLQVIGRCKQIDATVRDVSQERDGDLHIRAAVAAQWVNSVNASRQHGDLVVEYMPTDSWPTPKVGDRLRLTCTWARDLQHGGWNECHPVWAVQPLGAAAGKVLP